MTQNRPESRIPESEHMTTATASVFLRLGMSGPRRPVDDLIDRLRQPDGGAWLIKALENGSLNGLGSAASLLGQGEITIEQCVKVKERSKAMVASDRHSREGGNPEAARVPQGPDARLRGHDETGHDARLAGIAGYFLSIAAGLRFHDVLLTTRERTKLAETWLDLAEVAPEPFSTLLSEAALAHQVE
jgi:hypothetical protein